MIKFSKRTKPTLIYFHISIYGEEMGGGEIKGKKMRLLKD